jgi:hypothetical protein
VSLIPKPVQQRVRVQARQRCGYCHSQQQYVLGPLEMEHIIAQARGGTDDEENLWLACRLCNGFKGTQISARDPLTGRRSKLFNPRQQQWRRHFTWTADGTRIIGLTVCGRATAAALQVNNLLAVMVRREWVKAGWHPPPEDQ